MKEQTIKLSVLNELMSEKTRSKYKVSTAEGHKGISSTSGDGYQGEYNETFEYFQHPELPENIFLQITYRTDSYGYNDYMHEMKFVEGKAKTITVYEPI